MTANALASILGLMPEVSAYLNGAWVPSSDLCISIDDVGFLLGATVTERLRTFRGQVFRLEAHLERLRHSLDIVGLNSGPICDQVKAAVLEFLRRNQAMIDSGDDWSIVAFATPGPTGSRQPTVCIHGHALPFRLWATQYETGLSVVISHIRQVPTDCWPAELKCRSRMHYYLADREAAAKRSGRERSCWIRTAILPKPPRQMSSSSAATKGSCRHRASTFYLELVWESSKSWLTRLACHSCRAGYLLAILLRLMKC